MKSVVWQHKKAKLLLVILIKYVPGKEELKQLEETAPTLYQEIFHLFAEWCKVFFQNNLIFIIWVYLNISDMKKHLVFEDGS